MNDRKMLKWEPFNAVIPANKVINHLALNKEKIKKPELSDDQLKEIENKILDAFNLDIDINILYYENGYIKSIKEKIKKIDVTAKKVYLNHKTIYFSQIVRVN